MDKEKIITLTNNLYKLTLLFPKKEPLRYKTREVADEILNNLVAWEVINRSNPIKFLDVDNSEREKIIINTEKNLEILKSYFGIIKWQNWVSYFDISKIEEEYNRIKDDFKKEIEDDLKNERQENLPGLKGIDKEPFFIPKKGPEKKNSLNSRKQKILKFLEEKGRVQVWQIKEIFPQVSKRTLRRDFEQLLRNNRIARIGERNNTFYKLRKE